MNGFDRSVFAMMMMSVMVMVMVTVMVVVVVVVMMLMMALLSSSLVLYLAVIDSLDNRRPHRQGADSRSERESTTPDRIFAASFPAMAAK